MLEARAATRATGTQLLACVGGNGRSDGFSAAVAKADRRQKFVESLVALCDKHDLDGVDLNWEYPLARGMRPRRRCNATTRDWPSW